MATPKAKAPKIQEHTSILAKLQLRFEANMSRHQGLAWRTLQERLLAQPAKLRALEQMEESGGEPDVVSFDKKSGEYVFFDCSPETPKGRTSLCYDAAARDERKENKPRGSAVEMAAAMGAVLLTENQYRTLQALGDFDTKTSSWIATPEPIRKLGGALFGDRRFDHVFVYHNGAQSYYAARGFRVALKV